MRQLSGQDASFIYLENKQAPMHVAGLSLYDASTAQKKVDFQAYRQFLSERLHTSRAFRERFVRVPFNIDHPFWIEDPEFDLDYHLHHVYLPRPGTWQQLMDMAGRIMSRPLDQSRPLWEMYFIEGLDKIPHLPKGAFGVLTKVHHAAIDGVAGSDMIMALHDTSRRPKKPKPPEKEWEPEEIPSDLEILAKSSGHLLRRPLVLAEVIGEAAASTMRVRSASREMEDGKEDDIAPPPGLFDAPPTPFNVHVTQQRAVGSSILSMEKIRKIRELVPGTTHNDAILAICGGALRRYLKRRHELPAQSLVVAAPVSIRSESEHGDAGNKVSAMFVRIGTDIEDNLERLKAVHQIARGSKKEHKARGSHLLSHIQDAVPGMAAIPVYRFLGMLNAETDLLNPGVNLFITNVPGPRKPLYINGAQLVMTCGLAPLFEGLGLIIAIYTYCDACTITATSTQDIMPDIETFTEDLSAVYKEYLALAAKAAKPRKKKAAAKRKPAAKRKTAAKAGTRRKAKPAARATSSGRGRGATAKSAAKAATAKRSRSGPKSRPKSQSKSRSKK